MKLISWNVNGLRACVGKGFLEYFESVDADMFCLQEIKLQGGQIDLQLDGYHQYWNYALKKGYSGTAVFTKEKPLSVKYGVGDLDTEGEGRILTLEFPLFYLVNVYTPNAQRDLARLPLRLEWEDDIRAHLKKLDEVKPVILCGDLNVAHQEIDIRNVKSNIGNSGFTDEERGKMTELLAEGFIDTFRYFHPDKEDAYTWWSYMSKVRERNIGWRIDYFIASKRLGPYLNNADIHPDILGSDHCPIVLEMNLTLIG
jgi:exodeoxyribonuclease III